MTRQTILTPAIQDAMVNAIAAGSYAYVAADFVGISRSTHYAWLERGELGEAPFSEYLDAIRKAEAASEVRNVAIIQKAADEGDWRASITYLERKFPDRWGKRERNSIELTGANGAPIELTISDPKAVLLAMLGHTKSDASDGSDAFLEAEGESGEKSI